MLKCVTCPSLSSTMNWWITADPVTEPQLHLFLWLIWLWGNTCWSIVCCIKKNKKNCFKLINFVQGCMSYFKEVSDCFHVNLEQWAMEVRGSVAGQLCSKREGLGQRWDERGSSSLWSHPFQLGPFSRAPKQLLQADCPRCVYICFGCF